jgi:hypothetical protein
VDPSKKGDVKRFTFHWGKDNFMRFEIDHKVVDIIYDFLISTTEEATDGITTHLSPSQLNKGDIMLKKLKKFISKQGSEFDEMRGKIRRLAANLSTEKGAREALQARFDALEMSAMNYSSALQIRINALEMSAVNTSSLVKAFDLIKLFRSYYLTSHNWNAVTNEYKGHKDQLENRLIETYQFDQFMVTFNAKYPMPPDTPLLSNIIDLCQERHDEAHSGQIKTIVKQEKFLEDCVVYFDTHPISDNTRQVCFPILKKMNDLKIAGQLKGLDGKK